MQKMEWNEYWNVYQDWKYPCTVILCIAIGYFVGYTHCKEKAENLRLAITNAIEQGDCMNSSVIVYGDAGCGKSINAEKMSEYFGLVHIKDDWDGKEPVDKIDTLILTNLTYEQLGGKECRRCLSFESAMRRIGYE